MNVLFNRFQYLIAAGAAGLLVGGGLMASRQADLAPPEENRFTKVVLAEKLNEPMEMAFLPDGRILWVERKGTIKLMNPDTRAITDVGTLSVSTKYTAKDGKTTVAEDGLLGITVDPNFTQNHWLYLYYSPEGPDAKNIIARYDLKEDKLVEASKKVVLEVATQREQCCHTGGGMTWDRAGNLYLSTGDNTSPRATGFAPLDERADRSPWDAQKSSGNTNDLRGKIIRIHPEADGSYTIPDGNLFPRGTPKTRPEIYTMGHRNPWRLSIDSKTGYLYWGEVGPDASADSVGWGPRGYDEFNQARRAGNFGWPLVIANNQPYGVIDFATNKPRFQIDPAKPINTSPNNTGLTVLPPAQKAFIWYPYGASKEFPLLGSSGRSATGGPVFRMADFKGQARPGVARPGSARPFPAYYEGKWFITDFMRGWIMVVTMDEQGNYQSMERFLPGETIGSTIDMKFAPNGDLYVLEYGSAWFRGNDNARIVRFEYNAGNRKPVVQASASKRAGALPFRTQLLATGTRDDDRDALKYSWTVRPISATAKGVPVQTFTQANPIVTFDRPDMYRATLTATDPKGASNSQSIDLTVGNEPPVVHLAITKGNRSFFFPGTPVSYTVAVVDKEDGRIAGANQVAITANYLPEGYDPIEVAQAHRDADASAQYATAQRLIKSSDCMACHQLDKRSLGPGFTEIAQRYQGQQGAVSLLAQKVIKGGNGVWGDHSMSAHPTLSEGNAAEMVKYILSFSDKKESAKKAVNLPLSGELTPSVPSGENGKGGYVLRAAYRDRGAKGTPSMETERVVILRNPVVAPLPDQFDATKGVTFVANQTNRATLTGDGAYLAMKGIDLEGISTLTMALVVDPDGPGGTLELHLDSPTGPLVGSSSPISSAKTTRYTSTKVTIAPTTGVHTLYIVCRNTAARADAPLLHLSRLQFQP